MTMKKSKKFIKFKDYIIKLPNSMGLINSKNNLLSGDLRPFVEQTQSNGVNNSSQQNSSDVEGPPTFAQIPPSNSAPFDQQLYGYSHGQNLMNSHMQRDKGYSIYVVDDEHEIHRFDIDTYEWTIISTTKDLNE